jgi:hypothetical protein
MRQKDILNLGVHYFRLARFMLRERLTESGDRLLDLVGIPDKSVQREQKPGKITVVFAGQVINHRILKISKWLLQTGGYECILLCHQKSVKADVLPDCYSQLIEFRNKQHLKRIIKNARGIDLIVAFASKPSYAEVAVRYSTVPVIFDAYDCMVIYHGTTSELGWLRKELISERYCFQHADAILARSLENWMALRLYGIQAKRSLFFADYCDNGQFTNSSHKSATETHVVYSGSIHGRHLKNKLAQGLTDFFELIEALDAQSIHFHIYPSPFTSPENYYDYVEASHAMHCLHVHSTIAQNQLSSELSQYHFGALPHFRTAVSKISDEKLDRASSLKFYSYLEAGLPLLVSDEMEYMSWLVKRYRIGVVFGKADFPQLKELLSGSHYPDMQKNVLEVREKLSMAGNIRRLAQFLIELKESPRQSTA